MSMIPSGTVTLLAARDADALPEALGRLVDAHGGYLFAVEPDGWAAAFASPPAALAAAAGAVAAAIERSAALPALAAHTGNVRPAARDYAGPVLERARHVLNLATSGQVLVTRACRLLAEDSLPRGLRVDELGSHRLPDLLAPEELGQLVGAGVPNVARPPRGLEARPTNLPTVPSRFVGRDDERRELAALVRSARLVALTGAGGSGKTRLALQVAADLLDDFPDGVWHVDLAPVAEDDDVPAAAAAACGVREEPGAPLEDTLAHALGRRRVLLILDAADAVRDGAARLAVALLERAPGVHVVATAAEPLGPTREAAWRVPSLPLPDPVAEGDAGELGQYAAFELFAERAEAAAPGLVIDAATTPAIADLCFRLDGMPLPIEIAAAALRDLPLADVAAGIATAFDTVATVDARTVPPRPQVLRTALGWRLGTLAAEDRALLGSLAAFAGGFVLPAAEAVAGRPREALAARLAWLAERGLLARDEGDPDGRWRLPDPVRAHLVEGAVDPAALAAARDRHLAHFAGLCERSDRELTGGEQARWLDRMDGEHDNLRAALDWAVSAGRTEAALRMGASLWRFWAERGHLSEGRRWLVRILELPGTDAHPGLLARAVYSASAIVGAQGDDAACATFLDRAEALFAASGDVQGEAWVHNDRGLRAIWAGDYGAAREALTRSLAHKERLGTAWDVAITLGNLGWVASLMGRHDEAAAWSERALELARGAGHELLIGRIEHGRAEDALLRGDFEGARRHLAACRSAADAAGAPVVALAADVLAARLGRAEGHAGDAASALHRALEACQALEGVRDLAPALDVAACLAADRGRHRSAAVLSGAADRAYRRAGMVRPAAEDRELAGATRGARDGLGAGAFEAARGEGRVLPADAALALALAEGGRDG